MSRNRTLGPAMPFIFIHGGNGQVLTTTPTSIIWNHTHYKTSAFIHNNGDTKITIHKGENLTRLYEIIACVGAIKTTGNPTELKIQVYINGTLCECSEAHGSIGAGTEHSDATIILIKDLKATDTIEIYGSINAGTATVEGDSARIIIKGLPMEGWDNGRGGDRNIRVR